MGLFTDLRFYMGLFTDLSSITYSYINIFKNMFKIHREIGPLVVYSNNQI